MKIIYIASLSHSGSTLLDVLLSCHPKVVGLGEIHYLSDPIKRQRHIPYSEKRFCSCGQTLSTCPVWSKHIVRLSENPDENYAFYYKRILDTVTRQYGKDIIISDSSKYLTPLSMLCEILSDLKLTSADMRVIHLVRDVRGYAVSQKVRHERKNWRDILCFREWISQNKEMEALITAKGLKSIKIGYEELCLYPEFILRIISDFVGIGFIREMLAPANATGHIGCGNPMHRHPKKSDSIYYDNRWFIDDSINFTYMLSAHIRQYNRENVYGNTLTRHTDRKLFDPP